MYKKLLVILFVSKIITNVQAGCISSDVTSNLFYAGENKDIVEDHCTGLTFSEVKSYIANRPSKDRVILIEESDIGKINTELIEGSLANYILSFACINCNIKSIEKKGLNKLTYLHNFTLYGNNIGEFDASFINEKRHLFRYLNLTLNNITKVKNLCNAPSSLNTIVLKDNPIKNINEQIFSDCKDLSYLDISNTSIELTKNILNTNTKLTELHAQNILSGNLENIYLNLPNLITLDVSFNNLHSFGNRLFEFFASLKILNLNNNKINNIICNTKTCSFPLRQLHLRNNNIINLTNIHLEYFTELQFLDLSFNKINNIICNTKTCSFPLRQLYLSNNNLVNLTNIHLEYFAELHTLDLSNNNINNIICNTQTCSFLLRQLYLSNNNLANLTNIHLEYFTELTFLDLSFNKIIDIPVNFFEHNIDLRQLMLNNNQLKTLPVGLFSPTPRIVRLDISFNNFTAFDELVLYPLQNLPNQIQPKVSTIKKLDVSNLKWSCENLHKFIKYCESNNLDCRLSDKSNFQTSNLQGVTCSEVKVSNSTRNNSLEQKPIVELSSVHGMLIVLTVLVFVFVIMLIIFSFIFVVLHLKQNRLIDNTINLSVRNKNTGQNPTYDELT